MTNAPYFKIRSDQNGNTRLYFVRGCLISGGPSVNLTSSQHNLCSLHNIQRGGQGVLEEALEHLPQSGPIPRFQHSIFSEILVYRQTRPPSGLAIDLKTFSTSCRMASAKTALVSAAPIKATSHLTKGSSLIWARR